MAQTLTAYIVEKATNSRSSAKSMGGGSSTATGTILNKFFNKNKRSKSNRTSGGGSLTSFLFDYIKKEEENKKSFLQDLKDNFDKLSEKTTLIKSKIEQQKKLYKRSSGILEDITEKQSSILSLIEKRSQLEKSFFELALQKLQSIEIPEIKVDSVPQEQEESSVDEGPQPDKAPDPQPQKQWWEFWKPDSPDKKAEGAVVPSSNSLDYLISKKAKDREERNKYASVLQSPLKASGLYALSVTGSFLESAGALSGFLIPFSNSTLKPFGESLGVNSSQFSKLLGLPLLSSKTNLRKLQLEFANTWYGFMTNKNFIDAFIDRSGLDDVTRDILHSSPILTGDLAQKSKQFAEYLMSKHGLTDFQAAAVVGVMIREGFGSGKPDVRQGSQRGAPTYDGSSSEGYGWIQWTNTRGGGPDDRLNRALIHLGMGPPPKETRPWTDQDNIKVMEFEWSKHYTQTLPKLKATTNINDAVLQFVGNYTAGSIANIQSYKEREARAGIDFLKNREYSAAGVFRLLQGEKVSSDELRTVQKLNKGGKFGNNISSRLVSSFVVDGSDSGYPAKIQGMPVELHGKELIKVYNKGFEVYPIENKEYSLAKDPLGVMERWSEISSRSKLKSKKSFAAGGVSEGVKAIQHDEALSSLSRGRNDFISDHGPSVISSTPWSKVTKSSPIYSYETGVSGDRTTIGWGMTYYDSITAGTKAVRPGDVITKEKADILLTGLVKNYENTLKGQKWYQKYWNKMTAKQQAGLLAYGYNQPAHLLGTGAPKMYAALNKGDMKLVAANISRGLPKREKNEKRLVLSGPTNLNTVTAEPKPKPKPKTLTIPFTNIQVPVPFSTSSASSEIIYTETFNSRMTKKELELIRLG